MSITRARQILLDGTLLIGDLDTIVAMGRPAGLYGSASIRRRQIPRGRSHGDRITRQSYGGRLITVTVAAPSAVDETEARALLDALLDAWVPPDGTTEQTLDVLLPGTTDLRFYGQCSGLPEALSLADEAGMVQYAAEFWAADPFAYGLPRSETLSSASAAYVSAGNIATDRCTVTIIGNASTPVVTNSTDGRALTWAGALANGATRIVDLRAQTVVDGSGVDKSAELVMAGPFPRVIPGSNTWAKSGCGNVTFAWRDAHHV
jgi:hypothetical protein